MGLIQESQEAARRQRTIGARKDRILKRGPVGGNTQPEGDELLLIRRLEQLFSRPSGKAQFAGRVGNCGHADGLVVILDDVVFVAHQDDSAGGYPALGTTDVCFVETDAIGAEHVGRQGSYANDPESAMVRGLFRTIGRAPRQPAPRQTMPDGLLAASPATKAASRTTDSGRMPETSCQPAVSFCPMASPTSSNR